MKIRRTGPPIILANTMYGIAPYKVDRDEVVEIPNELWEKESYLFSGFEVVEQKKTKKGDK
tara:strand:+ start:6 stop:188 length:183 start_codon:yes stop_codon:yes gene_type:complete